MHSRKISVIGLGYVGLPMAVEFAKHGPVIGFDINPNRVAELRLGFDRTLEVDSSDLNDEAVRRNLILTNNETDLRYTDFHIIAVPTPIDDANKPDLTPVLKASITVGEQLKNGDIVCYESTVYPGCTEEDCVPVLEGNSGLQCGKDFFVAYSPERINPGDKVHTFKSIVKVVSGQTPEVCDIAYDVYSTVITGGVHKAPSIQVAEASKVIENTQRDINISLMNELALICGRLGINVYDVLESARTKWNFLDFKPGLVGGHCIGVDPWYLIDRSTRAGYTPRLLTAARGINDEMGCYIANQIVKRISETGKAIKDSVVTVLGLTFKENCPDLRNTKVIGIIKELEQWGVIVQVYDPLADSEEAKQEYGIIMVHSDNLSRVNADCVVLAVAHNEFVEMGWGITDLLYDDDHGVVVDIKGILNKNDMPRNVVLWQL